MQRKKPFSGKQKREQLQAKKKEKQDILEKAGDELLVGRREKQKLAEQQPPTKSAQHTSTSESEDVTHSEDDTHSDDNPSPKPQPSKQPQKKQPPSRGGNPKKEDRNKLRTVFEREFTADVQQRKLAALQPVDLSKRNSAWSILDEYKDTDIIDIPKRPPGAKNLPPEQEEILEEQHFAQWLQHIKDTYPADRLNYFEQNLEVWRQLWRVCEKSDIVLLITDARYPIFHFPPALYRYVTQELKKPILLVLNKIDLVEPEVVAAWEKWFKEHYPNLQTVTFSSFSLWEGGMDPNKRRKTKKGLKRYETVQGVEKLLQALQQFEIKGKKITITKAESPDDEKHTTDDHSGDEDDDGDDDSDSDDSELSKEEDEDESDDDDEEELVDEGQDDHIKQLSRKNMPKAMRRKLKREARKQKMRETHMKKDRLRGWKEFDEAQAEHVITVGTVGHPNVGKSSLINGLMGRKVVSTSRTPGHTKHLQTLFLTPEVQLCDCPGLVFPALDRPKALQILCGLFPIAQVREPFSAIRYLAERAPVERVYGLKSPEADEPWSPFTICEAFALKRGYLTSKTGRPDVHRAGLEILRDCVDGHIVISWPPPGFRSSTVTVTTTTTSEDSDNESGEEGSDDESGSDDEEQRAKKLQKKLQKKQQKKKELRAAQMTNQRLDDLKLPKKPQKKPKKPAAAAPPPKPTGKKMDAKALKAQEYLERLQEKQKKAGGH